MLSSITFRGLTLWQWILLISTTVLAAGALTIAFPAGQMLIIVDQAHKNQYPTFDISLVAVLALYTTGTILIFAAWFVAKVLVGERDSKIFALFLIAGFMAIFYFGPSIIGPP